MYQFSFSCDSEIVIAEIVGLNLKQKNEKDDSISIIYFILVYYYLLIHTLSTNLVFVLYLLTS